jgi:hypothetical protein
VADNDKGEPLSPLDWRNSPLAPGNGGTAEPQSSTGPGGYPRSELGRDLESAYEQNASARKPSPSIAELVEGMERPRQQNEPRGLKASGFDAADFGAAAICSLFAIPICDASWHAIVVEHEAMTRGIIGLFIGVPIGLAGFSFHWWKDKAPGFRDWFIPTAKRWWPAAAGLAFVYVAGPEIFRRTQPPVSISNAIGEIPTGATPANESEKSPPKNQSEPRSKQAINELLDESAAISSVLEKSGIPLINEWREYITTQNPERVCLDIDSRALQDKITALANKLDAAHREISSIYEKNRIDQPEFNKIFGSQLTGVGASGFAASAQPLRQYAHEINLLGEHPNCEALIRTGNIPNMFVNMIRGLDQFSIWIAQSQESLSRYRDSLRKELRNAP